MRVGIIGVGGLGTCAIKVCGSLCVCVCVCVCVCTRARVRDVGSACTYADHGYA